MSITQRGIRTQMVRRCMWVHMHTYTAKLHFPSQNLSQWYYLIICIIINVYFPSRIYRLYEGKDNVLFSAVSHIIRAPVIQSRYSINIKRKLTIEGVNKYKIYQNLTGYLGGVELLKHEIFVSWLTASFLICLQ